MKSSHMLRPACLFAALCVAQAHAASTDLLYPPKSSAGHDFNHSPLGQSFTATAPNVRAGIYLADENSFTSWLATIYPGLSPYPYAVAPSVTVRADLLSGEGTGGTVLYSTTRTLTAPFSGFVEVDYGAAGVTLTVGQKYTLMLTDVSGQAYPQGVSGWLVPAVTDPTPGAGQPVTGAGGAVVGYLPYGAYYGGLPILQGLLVSSDAGVGDNAFEVIDNAPAAQACSGTNAAITAYVARNPGFITVNGGLNLLDHLWTTNLNPANTTFLGGLVNWYQTGLLVDYTGVADASGCILSSLTVKPVPAALVVSAANLPDGTAGTPYSAAVTVTGGVPPYAITVGGLPAGLSSSGPNLSGTPQASGVSALTVTATDATGTRASSSPTLTINPAAANYAIKDEGQGKITAVGAGYLMIGGKKLIWGASTVIIVNTPDGEKRVIDSFVKPGMVAQWKGRRDKTSNTVLTSKLEVN